MIMAMVAFAPRSVLVFLSHSVQINPAPFPLPDPFLLAVQKKFPQTAMMKREDRENQAPEQSHRSLGFALRKREKGWERKAPEDEVICYRTRSIFLQCLVLGSKN